MCGWKMFFIVVSNAIMTLLVTPPQSFTKSALNLFTLKSSNNQRMIITCHGSLGLSKLIPVPARWNSGNNFKRKKYLIVYFSLLPALCTVIVTPRPSPTRLEKINDQLIKVSINVCLDRTSVRLLSNVDISCLALIIPPVAPVTNWTEICLCLVVMIF